MWLLFILFIILIFFIGDNNSNNLIQGQFFHRKLISY